MSVDEKPRSRRPRGRILRLSRRLVDALWPTQRQILTREGFIYFCVSVALLGGGLLHQVNLILLVFTLSAGPFLASIFGGRTMLRRLNVQRRLPTYVFSGDRLIIDYTVENGRRWFAALALFLEDSMVPVDRSVSGATNVTPRIFFARVAGRDRRESAGSQQVPSGASINYANWIWAPGRPSGWSSIASRSRIATRCWCIPRLAISPVAGF